MRIVLATLAVMFLAMPYGAKAGPSFDCKGASTWGEMVICGDDALADLDQRMSGAYKQALQLAAIPSLAQVEQQQWLRSRDTLCRLAQRGPLPEGVDIEKAKACVSNLYQRRLALLEALGRGKLINCDEQVTVIDQAVCPVEPTLQALKRVMSRVSELAGRETDPTHRVRILSDEKAWEIWLIQKYDENRVTDKNRAALQDQIGGAIVVRLSELDALEHPSVEVGEHVPLPNEWWGVDLFQLAKRDDVEVGRMFTGPSGHLVVMTTPNNELAVKDFVKTHKVVPSQPSQFLYIDVVTGDIIVNAADRPELIHTGGPALQQLHASLGLREFQYGQWLFGMPISEQLKWNVVSDNCPRPVQLPVSITYKGQMLFFPGVYVAEALPAAQSFQHNQPRCGDDGDTWAANFRMLFTQFVGRMDDGAVVAILGGRYLVRLRPDFSSPFFVGRTDITTLPESVFEGFSGEDRRSLAAVRAVIDDAIKRQTEISP